jgi:hypothetical protein
LLDRAGGAISTADAEAVTLVRDELRAYAGTVAVGHLGEGFWPVAGAVLVNLRNILDALNVVIDARPAEVPRPTVPPRFRHRRPPASDRPRAVS